MKAQSKLISKQTYAIFYSSIYYRIKLVTDYYTFCNSFCTNFYRLFGGQCMKQSLKHYDVQNLNTKLRVIHDCVCEWWQKTKKILVSRDRYFSESNRSLTIIEPGRPRCETTIKTLFYFSTVSYLAICRLFTSILDFDPSFRARFVLSLGLRWPIDSSTKLIWIVKAAGRKRQADTTSESTTVALQEKQTERKREGEGETSRACPIILYYVSEWTTGFQLANRILFPIEFHEIYLIEFNKHIQTLV